MAFSEKHSPWAVKVDTTVLGGITRLGTPLGTVVRGDATSGEPWARIQTVVAHQPRINFTTMAIAKALSLAGVLGVDVETLGAGFTAYAQAHAIGGTRAGDSSHRSFSAAEGMLVPRRLTIEGRGDASIDYEMIAISDETGANAPLVIADGISLPAGIADDERFGLGPVTIANLLLEETRSLELDFGLNVVTEHDQSTIYDTFAGIETVAPVLTIRGRKLLLLDNAAGSQSTIPMDGADPPEIGKAATHATTKIYLRKRAAGATFVANNVAQHVKFTCDGLMTVDDAQDGGASGGSEIMITVRMKYDETNTPLVVTLDTTIT